MEQPTPHEIYNYWQEQRRTAVRALEVAEEMLSFYAVKLAARRELDHRMAQESQHFYEDELIKSQNGRF